MKIADDTERRIGTKELCDHYSVSRATVGNWRKRGMPCMAISSHTIRYDLLEVEQWLEQQATILGEV